MRVLIAGDTHGNSNWMQYLFSIAERENCGSIFVVGDFGFWPGPGGVRFLDECERLVKVYGIQLDWLDGNHEWHDALDQHRHATETWEMRPGVTYYPRAYRFEWDGLRVMTLGGAWSIDKGNRTPHVSWWPQEEIVYGDVLRALDGPPVDLLLTHDMPNDAEALTAFGRQMASGGFQNRQAISEVRYALKPTLLVHGHMHRRYTAQVDVTTVLGLDCDNAGKRSWVVYDTDRERIGAGWAKHPAV